MLDAAGTTRAQILYATRKSNLHPSAIVRPYPPSLHLDRLEFHQRSGSIQILKEFKKFPQQQYFQITFLNNNEAWHRASAVVVDILVFTSITAASIWTMASTLESNR
jgi:hypothetical protein